MFIFYASIVSSEAHQGASKKLESFESISHVLVESSLSLMYETLGLLP